MRFLVRLFARQIVEKHAKKKTSSAPNLKPGAIAQQIVRRIRTADKIGKGVEVPGLNIVNIVRRLNEFHPGWADYPQK